MVLLLACTHAGPAPGAEDAAAEIPEAPEDATCAEREGLGCAPGGKAELVCTGGTVAEVPCHGDDGSPTRCAEGRCLVCEPHDKRCLSEDQVEVCGEDGAGWVPDAECHGESTGQVCQQGSCVALCALADKWQSYMGCEYWGADLDNGFVPGGNGGVIDAAGGQYAVVVSNPSPKYPMAVEIHDADGPVVYDAHGDPLPIGKILPRGLRVFNLARRDVDGSVLAPLGYRVTTSIPGTVAQFNPLENEGLYSNDASLLLPINVLDRWYRVISREQSFEDLRGFLAVIGTRADTSVTVTVSAHTVGSDDLPALSPGESVTRTLGAFDVLNIETDGVGEDLTGSLVQSTAKVAVFGGSEGGNVPNTNRCDLEKGVCVQDGTTPCETHAECIDFITCCADHLEMQLPPIESWGTRYVCARMKPRGTEAEYWRIMAAVDDTVIATIPPVANIPVLHAGEWFEIAAAGDFELTATHPVMVGEFMASEQAPEPGIQPGDAGIGDPAFTIAVPVEQLRRDYVVLTPPYFAENWLTVFAPLGSTVHVDGAAVPTEGWAPVGTGEYVAARVPVESGVHVLESIEKFGVTVYGYDQYVSYAYPGGLDVHRLDLLKPPP